MSTQEKQTFVEIWYKIKNKKWVPVLLTDLALKILYIEVSHSHLLGAVCRNFLKNSACAQNSATRGHFVAHLQTRSKLTFGISKYNLVTELWEEKCRNLHIGKSIHSLRAHKAPHSFQTTFSQQQFQQPNLATDLALFARGQGESLSLEPETQCGP